MNHTPWRGTLFDPKKILIRSYQAASGWRYQATCQCGWSADTPGDLAIHLFPNAVRQHRSECRRCL